MSSGVDTQTCPTCSTTLPVHYGYVTWCHECGWNIAPPSTRNAPRTRFDRVYADVGRRVGLRLVRKLQSLDELEPHLTPVRIAAYSIAALVYLVTLAVLGATALLALIALSHPLAWIAVVFLALVLWLVRPRFGKAPDEDVVRREDAPMLHAAIKRVAEALEVRTADVVVVDDEFNASWAVLGLAKRRRVIELGLPLLTILDPQERIALVAHELAHARNGDASRGLFVGSAVRALAEMYAVLAPEDLHGLSMWGDLAFFDRILNMLMWVVSRPVWWLLQLELHLLLRDSQRAEFLADALAAKIAGTQAVLRLSEKTLLDSTFRWAVQRAAQDRSGRTELFATLAAAVAAAPDRERERRRRVARLEATRLSSTHPPTAHRIQLLESRRAEQPAVVLTETESAAIDAELADLRPQAQAKLVETYRDSLYAR